MQLTVKLFAGLRQGRFTAHEFEFANGINIARVVEDLEIAAAEVGILLCNGRHTELSRELKDGDVVAIFPKVGGG